MDENTNPTLQEAMETIRQKMMEDPEIMELAIALQQRTLMRTLANMVVEGRVTGQVSFEQLGVTLGEGDETLSLRINNQPAESVPQECILLIVPDTASGKVNLIVVGDPDLSWVVFQDSNKPDTTDQTNQ